jgi:hypothetical protein
MTIKKIERAGLEASYGVTEVKFALETFGVEVKDGQIDPTQGVLGEALKLLRQHKQAKEQGSEEAIADFHANRNKKTTEVQGDVEKEEFDPLGEVKKILLSSQGQSSLDTQTMERIRTIAANVAIKEEVLIEMAILEFKNSPEFQNHPVVQAARNLRYLRSDFTPIQAEEVEGFVTQVQTLMGGQQSFLSGLIGPGEAPAPNRAAIASAKK